MPATITGNQSGTVGLINSATAQNSTSGTSIDFTGIPSGVRRITVMLNGVSTNTSSGILVQIGSGSVTTTGYTSQVYSSSGSGVNTSGFILMSSTASAAYTFSGVAVLNLISSNIWVGSWSMNFVNVTSTGYTGSGNSPALVGSLDRVRITTSTGTDTFDAGTINILYE